MSHIANALQTIKMSSQFCFLKKTRSLFSSHVSSRKHRQAYSDSIFFIWKYNMWPFLTTLGMMFSSEIEPSCIVKASVEELSWTFWGPGALQKIESAERCVLQQTTLIETWAEMQRVYRCYLLALNDKKPQKRSRSFPALFLCFL